MVTRMKTWTRDALAWGTTYLHALNLVRTAAPIASLIMVAMLLVQGIIPPLTVWLIKEVIDAIGGGAVGRGGFLIALWAATSLVGQLVPQWGLLVQAGLNERVTAHVELILMRKANSLPDLWAFEDPAFYDELQGLTRQAPYRPMNLMVTTASLVPNSVAAAGLLVLLGSLAWWLVPLLLAVTLLMGFANVRLQQQSWRIIMTQNPLTRAMRYFASTATTDTYAKEVRLLGLGPYFERRYTAASEALRREASRNRSPAGTYAHSRGVAVRHRECVRVLVGGDSRPGGQAQRRRCRAADPGACLPPAATCNGREYVVGAGRPPALLSATLWLPGLPLSDADTQHRPPHPEATAGGDRL